MVVLLARLLHKLQEAPSKDVNSAPASTPYKSVWYCVLQARGGIMEAMQLHAAQTTKAIDEHRIFGSEVALVSNYRQQLLEAGGGYWNEGELIAFGSKGYGPALITVQVWATLGQVAAGK